MKGLRVWAILTLLACNYFACSKKETLHAVAAEDPFISEAIAYLRNHTSPKDFDLMDLAHYQLIRVAGTGKMVARFADRSDRDRSVTIVRTDKGLAGNWIKMGPGDHPGEETWHSASLDGKRESLILVVDKQVTSVLSKEDGKMSVIKRKAGSRNIFFGGEVKGGQKRNPDDDEPAGQWLPEFVVLGYSLRDPTPFFSLFWLTDMNPIFLRSFIAGSIQIQGDAGGPEASPKGDEDAVELEEVRFDDAGYGLNLKELFKCFDNIPDAGAKYGITLYTDIPNDDDPSELLHLLNPGHSFISFTKTNGHNSVTQIFGFYPNAPSLTAFNLPVESRTVDNSAHEFNAKIENNDLNEVDFKAAENLATYLSNNLSYDLNDFNCTDYALEVFNKAQPLNDQINVPDWHINYNPINYGRTPNGLYQVLKEKKDSKGSDSNNIEIGDFKATKGQGPCK